MLREKKYKKIRSLLILVFALILIMGGSFAWLTQQLNSSKTNVLRAGSLSLVLDESGTNGINMTNAVPVSDTNGLSQEGYTFELKNTGNVASRYTIYLDDLALNEDEVRMPDSVVKYSLTKNGNSSSTILLSSVGSNPKRIVDSGTIAANTTNTYTLKVWMDSEATIDVMGTVFNAKLRVEAEQSNIKVEESDITVDMSNNDYKLDIGDTEDISNYTVESSDPGIATVNSDGVIVPVSYGVVTFNLKHNTTGAKKTVTVTITKTLNITYVKQSGVDSIERETDSCKLSNKDQTTCNITLPVITPSQGYSAVGWNKDKDATTGDSSTIDISEDTTLYTIVKLDEITYKASFVKPNEGVSSIGSEELTCKIDATFNGEVQATSCKVVLPEIVAENGYTVVGWGDSSSATTGISSGSEVELSSNKTFYAIVKKDAITISAKFYRNGAKSLDGSTEDFVTKTCVLEEVYNGEEQASSCKITTPVIEASDETPTVIGYSGSNTAIIADIGSNEELTLTGDISYYAITMSEAKTYVATFYRNGAVSLDDKKDEYITKQCNIAATYNGVAQDDGCNITSPVIVASDVTPTVLGYSIASGDHNIVWNSNEEKSLTANANYYAQTVKDAITLNVSYKIGANVAEIGKTSDTCEIAAVYNGTSQATSCSIEAPSITPNAGYTSVGWSKTNGDTTGSTSITLTEDSTYYANALSNSYTVEYYSDGVKVGSSGVKVSEELTLTSIETLNAKKEGYTFKGWATTEGSETVVYADEEKVTDLATVEGTIVKLYGVYVDDIAPVCTSTVTTAKIKTTDETTVIYTCTDLGSGITGQILSTSNFKVSNTTNGEIVSVSSPTTVTENMEYKYTVTVRGTSVGEFNLSLNAGVITDTAGNSNEASTSTNIEVEGITYTAKFSAGNYVNSVGSTTLSCTTTGSNTKCYIDLPEINVSDGYVSLGWYDTKKTTTTSDDELIGQAGSRIELSSDMEFIANARERVSEDVTFDSGITGYDCDDIQCAIDELSKEVG